MTTTETINVGDAVLLSRTIACVLYIGPVHWNTNKEDIYVGLELQKRIPNGHNGTYDGVQYFECCDKHGIILPISNVIRIIKPRELLSKLSELNRLCAQQETQNHAKDLSHPPRVESTSNIKVHVNGVLVKQTNDLQNKDMYRVQLKDSIQNTLTSHYITIPAQCVSVVDNDTTSQYNSHIHEPILTNGVTTNHGANHKNGHLKRDEAETTIFPIDFYLFSLGNKCSKRCKNCSSFKRIHYVLSKYKTWTETPQKMSGFYECIGDDINIKCQYNMNLILDDFHHLVHCHPYHNLYNNLDIHCHTPLNQYNKCVHLIRNFRKRCIQKEQIYKLYFHFKCVTEILLQQLCDTMHCYLCHSYDLFYGSPTEWKQILSLKRNEYIHELQRILKPKIQRRLALNFNMKHKFTSDPGTVRTVRVQNESIIYEFGSAIDAHSSKVYQSLKEELLSQLTVFCWDILYDNALHHQNKKYSQLLVATKDYRFDYRIARGDGIKLQHFISMMVYCNFAAYDNMHLNTFYRQYLFEMVHVYGTHTQEDSSFYHGIRDDSVLFESRMCCVKGALSTTSMLEIGLNYLDNDGLLLKLVENDAFCIKYFDASCVSDFVAENELFLIGNTQQSLFKFDAMIDAQLAADYTPYIICMDIIRALFNGKRSSFIDTEKMNINALFLKVIQLLKNEESNHTNKDIPRYISDLFHLFVMHTTHIYIKWNILSAYHSIKSYLCFPFMVNLRKLTSVFTNCREIKIEGIHLNTEELNNIYMYLLAKHSNSKCSTIIVHSINQISASILPLFTDKFQKINCQMDVNNHTEIVLHI